VPLAGKHSGSIGSELTYSRPSQTAHARNAGSHFWISKTWDEIIPVYRQQYAVKYSALLALLCLISENGI